MLGMCLTWSSTKIMCVMWIRTPRCTSLTNIGPYEKLYNIIS